MSENRVVDVYQQRFVSTEKTTDALNGFLKDPQDGFIFYAKKEYAPHKVKKNEKEKEQAYRQRIAERVITIRNHSLHLGVIGLQLAPPISALEHKNGVNLEFSSFAPGAYWRIMQEFYEDEYSSTPPDNILYEIAKRALHVDLPAGNLQSPAGFKIASNNLMQTLRDPRENYKMQVAKLGGVTEVHRFSPVSENDQHVV